MTQPTQTTDDPADPGGARSAGVPNEPWTGEWLGATYRAYYRPESYYRNLLADVAGSRLASLTEYDLDSLYDTPEPSGQRAWLPTLGDA